MSSFTETSLEQGGNDTEAELRRLRTAAIASHQRMASVRQWQRSRKAYLGMLYSDVEMPTWKAKGVHPKLWDVIQRMVAVLADRNPRFWPRPRGPENAHLSAVMQACADYEWDRQIMQSMYVLAARTLLIYGNAFFYTGVYPGLRDDDLYTQVLSPNVVFPDPMATSDSDLSYVWLHSRPSKADLVRLFGKKMARKIFEEVTPSSIGPIEGFRDMPSDLSPVDSYGTIGTAADYAAGNEIDTSFLSPTQGRLGTDARFDLWEGWLNEDAEVELDDDDDDSLMVSVPKGRRVIMIGDRYFPDLDTDNPFRHGQIPLSRMSCEELLGEFFGQGRILPLIDSAEQIADIDNLVLNNARLMLNAIWRVPTSSGIKITSFYPYPGMVIPYEGDKPPEPVPPPALPNYVFELRGLKQREFDDASGISDISRGTFEGGLEDVSGKAVGKLMEPMLTQLRPIARNMGQGISRWGYQTVCNAIQFWEDAKWQRILPEPLSMMPLPFIEIRDSGLPFTLLPDLRMEEGSTLPSDRERRASQAFNIYDRGAFGPVGSPGAAKELLDALEYPNADAIAQALAEFQSQPGTQTPGAADPGTQGVSTPAAPGVLDKALGGEPPASSEMAVEAGDMGQEVPL